MRNISDMEKLNLDIKPHSSGKYLTVSVKNLDQAIGQFDKFVYLEKTGLVSENIKVTTIPDDIGFMEYEKFYAMPGYSIYGANHKSNGIQWLATIYRTNSQGETP